MCKHVAAALYGVGARLDHDPDLLFTLRGVERGELVSADADLSITEAAADSDRVLADADVAALFGVILDAAPPQARAAVKKKTPTKKKPAASPTPARAPAPKKRAAKTAAARKQPAGRKSAPKAAVKAKKTPARKAAANRAASAPKAAL
jgi:uncharacterized Zn finger protein